MTSAAAGSSTATDDPLADRPRDLRMSCRVGRGGQSGSLSTMNSSGARSVGGRWGGGRCPSATARRRNGTRPAAAGRATPSNQMRPARSTLRGRRGEVKRRRSPPPCDRRRSWLCRPPGAGHHPLTTPAGLLLDDDLARRSRRPGSPVKRAPQPAELAWGIEKQFAVPRAKRHVEGVCLLHGGAARGERAEFRVCQSVGHVSARQPRRRRSAGSTTRWRGAVSGKLDDRARVDEVEQPGDLAVAR